MRDEFPKAMALFFALLLVAEVVARILVAPVGRLWSYWDPAAGLRFEYLAEHASELDAVVLGDSTAAWNIQPEALRQAAGWGKAVLNAGWDGNYPMAFACSTIPVLESLPQWPPRTIVSFAPGGFAESERVSRTEAGILGSARCRSLSDGFVVENWLHLTRLRGASPYLFRAWRGSQILLFPANGGFRGEARLSVPGPSEPRSAQPPPLVSTTSPRRMAVLERVAELARSRSSRLILLLPPSNIDWTIYQGYLHEIRQLAGRYDFEVADWRTSHGLGRNEFRDALHLRADGAMKFSRSLGQSLSRGGATELLGLSK